MTDFPTIVYRSPGPHRGPRGTTFDYLGVDDEAGMTAALSEGWHKTIDAALGVGKVIAAAEVLDDAIDEISPATRKELEQKAKQIGVKFNARTRDEVLAERIAEALDA